MQTATMTSKGQITIPLPVRISLGLNAGCRVAFMETAKGRYEIIPATEPVHALKGFLQKPDSPVSVEKMNEIIASCGAMGS